MVAIQVEQNIIVTEMSPVPVDLVEVEMVQMVEVMEALEIMKILQEELDKKEQPASLEKQPVIYMPAEVAVQMEVAEPAAVQMVVMMETDIQRLIIQAEAEERLILILMKVEVVVRV